MQRMLYMQGFFIYTHVYMSMSLFMTIDDKYTGYLSKQVVMERGRFELPVDLTQHYLSKVAR